jgi:hypothetical protein
MAISAAFSSSGAHGGAHRCGFALVNGNIPSHALINNLYPYQLVPYIPRYFLYYSACIHSIMDM